jgi:hypothetical protein
MSLMCICAFTLFIYERLTVPEENSDGDRHIKKNANKSYCQFFLPPFSLLLLFRVIQKKKNEPKRRKKQPIAQHHYRRHRHTRSSHHLASRSDHLHIYIDCVFFVVITTLFITSNNCFLFIFFLFSSTYITAIYNY